ncbi:MAG: GNAT family N-acetyltransferase [Candidatus Paceibacterota bacterium]
MQKSSLICDSCVIDRAGNQFSLWQGLNESHQQQVVAAAKNDPLVIKFTSDPQRFASLAKLKTWLAGERIVCALTPKLSPNKLVGLAWFFHESLSIDDLSRPSPLSSNLPIKPSHWTFGIRLYGDARGKRLSLPLMRKAFAHFWQKHPQESVWLSTAADNLVAHKVYERFGFEFLGEKDNRFFYLKNPN